jgi:hypothetical protein
MTPRFVPVLLAAVSAIGVLASCTDSAKPEAERLVATMDRFRLGARAEHGARAKEVEAVQANDPEVVDARRVCLEAVTKIVQSETIEQRVKDELAKGVTTLERHASLAKELDDAEKLVHEGYDRMPTCDLALNALKKRFSLRG